MARFADPAILGRLLDAAQSVFRADGYRLARVDTVARLAGVSVGTVYRYVEGKEALLELVVRRLAGDADAVASGGPFRAASSPALTLRLRTLLTAAAPLARLRAATHGGRPTEGAGEFAAIVRAVYRWYADYGGALSLMARCARDRPELAGIDAALRRDLHALLARYVKQRMDAGVIRTLPDAALAARTLAQNCEALAADRDPTAEDDAAEATLVGLMSGAFLA